MNRRTTLALLAGGVCATRLHADLANGDARLETLYGSFIAPCCWQENLRVHRSPMADEMRQEIQRRVAQGESDEKIKAAFVARHTLRVLSMPEGNRARWLSWTPIAATAAGLGFLAVVLKRSVKPQPPIDAANLPELEDFDDENR
jgi:cytochrome c-type biogenesis protein CcmH/NrfF